MKLTVGTRQATSIILLHLLFVSVAQNVLHAEFFEWIQIIAPGWCRCKLMVHEKQHHFSCAPCQQYSNFSPTSTLFLGILQAIFRMISVKAAKNQQISFSFLIMILKMSGDFVRQMRHGENPGNSRLPSIN